MHINTHTQTHKSNTRPSDSQRETGATERKRWRRHAFSVPWPLYFFISIARTLVECVRVSISSHWRLPLPMAFVCIVNNMCKNHKKNTVARSRTRTRILRWMFGHIDGKCHNCTHRDWDGKWKPLFADETGIWMNVEVNGIEQTSTHYTKNTLKVPRSKIELSRSSMKFNRR